VTVDLICRYNSTITVDSNDFELKDKKPVTKLAVEVSVLKRRKRGIWKRETERFANRDTETIRNCVSIFNTKFLTYILDI